jgi:spore coat polysaccharide biosynthesis protein SpsF
VPRVVAIVQARLGSTRLPGKVLLDVCGEPLLARSVVRAQATSRVDDVVVATTTQDEDDEVERLCALRAWHCFRGSVDDVLDRYYRAAREAGADHVVRITADDPFVAEQQVDELVAKHVATGADFTHNLTVWGAEMPLGTGAEVFTWGALEASWTDGREPHHREHVDEYVSEQRARFRFEMVPAPPELARPDVRLTVDRSEDLELVRAIHERAQQRDRPVPLREALDLIDGDGRVRALHDAALAAAA